MCSEVGELSLICPSYFRLCVFCKRASVLRVLTPPCPVLYRFLLLEVAPFVGDLFSFVILRWNFRGESRSFLVGLAVGDSLAPLLIVI